MKFFKKALEEAFNQAFVKLLNELLWSFGMSFYEAFE